MFMLRKYHKYGDHIICWDPNEFDKELSYKQELIILLSQYVRMMRTQAISCMKVWRKYTIEESTLETDMDMCK